MVYSLIQIGFPPENSPTRFIQQPHNDRPRILFAGDSITRGTVQPNWTEEVGNRFGDRFYYINGGVNGDTTADLLERIEDMLACKPNLVTLLIGHNNVMGSYERNKNSYKSSAQQDFSQQTFGSEFRQIVTKFLEIGSTVLVLSLVPYGEFVVSDEFDRSRQFSRIIKTVADELDCIYLPLFEKLEELLKEEGPAANPPPITDDLKMLMTNVLVRRRLFKQSWQTISNARSLRVTVDHIHANQTTCGIIAQLVNDTIAELY